MGLELFVGVIQAFIFSMLTLVFGVMAVASHGDHDDATQKITDLEKIENRRNELDAEALNL